MIKEAFSRLKQIWKRSDSQPTEITLAVAIAVLAPIAVSIEIHTMWWLNLMLVGTGLYQLRCIATCDIDCRIRAAYFTTMMYMTCLIFYLTTIGLPTPSHYGWLLLTYSSFSTLNRLKTEQLHRGNS